MPPKSEPNPRMMAERQYLEQNTAYAKQRQFGTSVRNGTIMLQIVVLLVTALMTWGHDQEPLLVSVFLVCMTTVLLTLVAYHVYSAIFDIADAHLLARVEARQAAQNTQQKAFNQMEQQPQTRLFSSICD